MGRLIDADAIVHWSMDCGHLSVFVDDIAMRRGGEQHG